MIDIDQSILDRHAAGSWQRSVNGEAASLASLRGKAKRYNAQYERSLGALCGRIRADVDAHLLSGYAYEPDGATWHRILIGRERPVTVGDLRRNGFTGWKNGVKRELVWFTPDLGDDLSIGEALDLVLWGDLNYTLEDLERR